jgi:hypothetical protein
LAFAVHPRLPVAGLPGKPFFVADGSALSKSRHIVKNRNRPEVGMRGWLTLFVTGAALASEVSPQQAAQVAQAWIDARLAPGQARAAGEPLSLPTDRPGAWLVPMQPGGFVLVAADDALRPVLGWSGTGVAGAGLPPALEAFLAAAQAEVLRVQAEGVSNAETRPEWDRVLAGEGPAERELGVLPLLSCAWDQGAGWNALCPADAAGPGGRVWAGCVAVSMAQVMHFWRQPLQGTGSHGYQSDYGWLYADFGAADYDWSQIADVSPTPEAAELLYHCGIAVNMGYSPDGSGAYVGWGNPCALSAMRNNFGFQASAHYITKSSTTWSGWRSQLRAELDLGRPILLCGYGTGGHAFNLDGWRENDYFHLNWGWSGAYNGWFLIDALSPGGNDFSQDEGAIVGLEPLQYQRAPVLVAPLNNSEDVECAPLTATWLPAEDAESYDLVIDDTADFLSPIVSLSGLTGESVEVEGLLHYSPYYWRIRSRGALGTGPWSPTAGFFTSYWNQTPPPVLATPADGAQNVHVALTVLVWDFVTGANSYGVQVDDDADFSSPLVDTLGVGTHYLLLHGALEPGRQYWWRAACDGLAGLSDWSPARSLFTEQLNALDPPASPLDWTLEPPTPNPFNPSTQLSFILPREARVDLRIYNLRGEAVAVLLENALLPAGRHQALWRAEGLPSGSYLAVLEADGRRLTRKATLLR